MHDQRVKLALAFKDNPSRNRPRQWEPELLARVHGKESPRSFRRYLLHSGREFEVPPLGDTVAKLRAMVADGWLADNFHTFDQLVKALEDAGAPWPSQDAFPAWRDFVAWRDPR